ncbi:hypothetical protein SAMN05445060_2684 [Williamsia sterculiae]|uniref:Uncharacterized protein n=1 Tax=Williamsia sterculiae TaxID=1344003 RepID=A0A1N7GEC7_9NOCA|nr:hypothetical protein SAMN05445060_2684 [Williamsia sterculiae]
MDAVFDKTRELQDEQSRPRLLRMDIDRAQHSATQPHRLEHGGAGSEPGVGL